VRLSSEEEVRYEPLPPLIYMPLFTDISCSLRKHILGALRTLGVKPEHVAIRVHLISKPPRKYNYDSCKSTRRVLKALPSAYHYEADVCFELVDVCQQAILLLGASRGGGPYTVDGEPFCHQAWGTRNRNFATIVYTEVSGQKGVESTFRLNGFVPTSASDQRDITELGYDVLFWVDAWQSLVETICRVVITRAQNAAAKGGSVFDQEEGRDPDSVEEPLLHGLLRMGKEETVVSDGVGTIMQRDLNQLMDDARLYEHLRTKELRVARVERLVFSMDNKALHTVMNNFASSSDRAMGIFGAFWLRKHSAEVFYQVHTTHTHTYTHTRTHT
jgi:hypothetical protein